jgi:hypothetical protein
MQTRNLWLRTTRLTAVPETGGTLVIEPKTGRLLDDKAEQGESTAINRSEVFHAPIKSLTNKD